MKTITILKPSEQPESLHNTYPIAVGLQTSCYEIVEQSFRKDLELLGTFQVNTIGYVIKTWKKHLDIH